LSEQEQDREDRLGWKDEVAIETGVTALEATGCCLLSLLHGFALLLLPASVLLLLIR
jgi:hypothetical protein